MALRATRGDECQRVTFERAVVLLLSRDRQGAVATLLFNRCLAARPHAGRSHALSHSTRALRA
jgi:hypothetical protein